MMPISMMMAAVGPVTLNAIAILGMGGALVAILLILLLSSRELVTASSRDSLKVRRSLDALIIPLFVVFVSTVAFQVWMVVSS